MKKLEISTKIALGTAFFFLVALIISQWCFYNKANHFVEEIRKLHIQRDSVLALLDTSKVSEQYITLQQESQEFQTERFTVELEKQKQNLFTYFIGFLGIGTLAGFFVILFLIPKEIEKRAKVEAELIVREKVKKELDDEISKIVKLIRNDDKEGMLIRQARIFIEGKLNDDVRDILKEYGISNENGNFVRSIDQSNIVFICDDERFTNINLRNQSQDEMENILEENQNTHWKAIRDMVQSHTHQSRCFFYYSNKGIMFPLEMFSDDIRSKARINFSTNPAQIYGNLLNTLKYQDKLQQRQ